MVNYIEYSTAEICNKLKYIQIFVQTPLRSTICLRLSRDTTVEEVKQEVAGCIGLPACAIELFISNGLKLCDDISLEEHGLENEINIRVCFIGGLLGGADKNPEDDNIPRKAAKLSHSSISCNNPGESSSPPTASNQLPHEEQDMAFEPNTFTCAVEEVPEGMDEDTHENRDLTLNEAVTGKEPVTRNTSMVDGDGNTIIQTGPNSKVAVYVNPQSEKQKGIDVTRCRQFLEQCYRTRLCKLPQFPGSSTVLNMDDIYTSICIEIELTKPGYTIKMPINDYCEMLERETNNGNRPTRLLVVGEGGSGKSTLTAKIAHDWVSGKSLADVDLLFVLNMRKIGHNSSLEDAIFEQLMPKDAGFTKEELHSYIGENQAKVMIVLDSYDEFKRNLQDEPKTNVVETLSYNMLINCRVVVTSRPWKAVDFFDLQREYTKFEVKGFTPEQVESYIKKFFKTNPNMAKSLLNYLKVNDFCPGIACVPLMTQLLCIFWKENKGDIPKRTGKLYTKIFATLLAHQESKESGCDQDVIRLHNVLKELGKIAFTSLWPPEDRLSFPQPEMEAEASNETVDMALQVGLLIVDEDLAQEPPRTESKSIFETSSKATKPNHLRFFHKTIQEKCAGEYIALLASEHPDEVKKHLKVLTSVKLCLKVKLILQFACGVNQYTSKLIMNRFEEIYRVHVLNILPEYYRDELKQAQVTEVQQFIELCLICNYESEARGEFHCFLNHLFPDGKMRYLGMSAYMSTALGHFLIFAKNIKSLTILEMPKLGDTIYYVVKSKVLQDVHRDVHKCLKQEDEATLKQTFEEYVKKGVLVKKTSNPNISNALADVQVWEKFKDLQPSSAMNLTPVLEAIGQVNLSVLDITEVNLNNSQCENLITCIENNNLASAVTLMFRQIGLKKNHVNRMVSAMTSRLPELKVLDISRNDACIPVQLGEVMVALQMTHLNVSFMSNNPTELSELIRKLPEDGPNLEEFRCEGNSTNKDVGQIFCNALPHLCHLRSLGIADVDELARDVHQRMLMGLGELKHLQELRIWDITVYLDDVLLCVANVVPSLPSLTYLSLRAKNAPRSTSPSLKKFLDALDAVPNMKRLFLLDIYFEQSSIQKVVEMGRKYEYEVLCIFRKMLAEGVLVPVDDFIQLY